MVVYIYEKSSRLRVGVESEIVTIASGSVYWTLYRLIGDPVIVEKRNYSITAYGL